MESKLPHPVEQRAVDTIDGVSVASLISQFDSPLYVYSLSSIKEQYEKMASAFKIFPHRIHYAIKAMNNLAILKFIYSLGASADTVSVEEIEFCLKVGFTPDRIIFTPSGPSEKDIDYALTRNIMITIDNFQNIEYIGKKYGSAHPISIRINPEVLSGGDEKISVAGKQSKFGLGMNKIEEAKVLCAKYSIPIVGLHIHTGSDISNAEEYFQAVDNLVKVALTFEKLQFIDLGSGFHVPYKPHDEHDVETDMHNYAAEIQKRYLKLKEKFGSEDFVMKFEPGKFIVSKSGYLLVSASVVKNNNGVNFAIVDSGLNHLIRPMMYSKAYHYITNASNPTGEKHKYNVCGYICETDTFGAEREISEIRQGDVLIIHNAGAYGMTMASNYNCKLRPAEVAVYQGKATLVRRRETFEDLISTQCIVDLSPQAK